VVGVVDQDAGRCEALATKYQAPTFGSVAELIARAKPKVAHVCTPVESHVPYARALLDAGCHVVCEKPLAPTSPEVATLLELASRAGRTLCPVHQFAMQPAVQGALRRMGAIGELRRVAFKFYSAGGTHQPSARLDEILLDILPHPLSMLARMEATRRLTAIPWRIERGAPGEAKISGAVTNALISIDLSLSARPTEASATIAGTQGSIDIDFFHGYAVYRLGRVSRWTKATQPFAASAGRFVAASSNLVRRAMRWEPAYPGLRDLLAACYQAVAGRGPAPFDDAEILEIYRARDSLAAQFGNAA
jgi:predicted dehydrogenase